LIGVFSADPSIDNYDSRGNPIHLPDNLEQVPGVDPDLADQLAPPGPANPPNDNDPGNDLPEQN